MQNSIDTGAKQQLTLNGKVIEIINGKISIVYGIMVFIPQYYTFLGIPNGMLSWKAISPIT